MRIKKHLGQNFLVDKNIINKIIKNINPSPKEHFLEIGPGRGALTSEIINLAGFLDAVEIDNDLINSLDHLKKINKDFRVFNEDILKFDLKKILLNKNNSLIRMVGNLPYNISSPILFWAYNYGQYIKDCHFMFQKEFAERLIAKPGSKSYGRLSIISQYLNEINLLFSVSSECFRPIPDVDSSIIQIKPIRNVSFNSETCKTLQKLTNILFSKRRKMIGKSLQSFLPLRKLDLLEIKPSQRPEELSVEKFVKLSEMINSL
ncbi:MAG: 16S rRNA (adenine(1518)-N(6)/adenine(1519)-N(6))-dimethyltransferase RsmA [SAR86 cluster bacterium]|nr:16S rRNA (adenine(1518)-N(6)/adenine(1519)-N(6))-dimethyltransferase RsmA [SAR86 cluster bacterium]